MKKIDSGQCPDLDAKKQNEFKLEWFLFSECRVLAVTLMNELKIVFTQKHFFDNRDESFFQ